MNVEALVSAGGRLGISSFSIGCRRDGCNVPPISAIAGRGIGRSQESEQTNMGGPAGPPKIMAPIGPSRNASIPSIFGAGAVE